MKGQELVKAQEDDAIGVDVNEFEFDGTTEVSDDDDENVGVDAASQEREEKGVDVDVDATGLDKNTKVSEGEESHPAEEIQLKPNELFDEIIQTKTDEFFGKNVQTNDDALSNDDYIHENGDHSNKIDDVNGNDDDQVKVKELFESIAVFLMIPFYKYRKKDPMKMMTNTVKMKPSHMMTNSMKMMNIQMEMLKKNQIPILMKENHLQQVQEEKDGNQTNLMCRNL